MKSYVNTLQALILRSVPIKEAEKFFSLFSKEKGIIQAQAKGVKKPSSKLGGHLDLFYHVQLELYQRNSLPIITGVKILNSFSSFRGNMKSMIIASQLSEIVGKLLEKEHAVPRLFDELISFLLLLSKKNPPVLFTEFFSIKALTILGYMPPWKHCTSCQQPLSETSSFFSLENSGPLCKNCTTESTQKISFPLIKSISFLQRTPIQDIPNISFSPEQQIECKNIIHQLLSPHLKTPLKQTYESLS